MFNVYRVFWVALACSASVVTCSGQLIKCKYEVNEFDSFTGSRTVKTKFVTLGKPESGRYKPKAAVMKVDSTYFLFITGIAGACVSDQDTEVSLKTVTGEIYSLKHIGEIDCGRTVYVSGASTQTQPVIYLRVSEEQVRKLAMSMVRITQGQVYQNVTVTQPMLLRQLFDCVDNPPSAEKK